MHPLPPSSEPTPDTFATMGLAEFAYVRRATEEEGAGFAICSANGETLAVAATREAAFGVVRQNDMEPVDTH